MKGKRSRCCSHFLLYLCSIGSFISLIILNISYFVNIVNILTGHLLYVHGVPTDGKSLGLVGILWEKDVIFVGLCIVYSKPRANKARKFLDRGFKARKVFALTYILDTWLHDGELQYYLTTSIRVSSSKKVIEWKHWRVCFQFCILHLKATVRLLGSEPRIAPHMRVAMSRNLNLSSWQWWRS